MKTPEEIVKALRCTSTAGNTCRKDACPYFYRTDRDEFGNVYPRPDDWFDSCDVDRISLDAADLIEQLLAQKGEE